MAVLLLFIVILVLSKKTAYPRWFALTTPLTGILLSRLLSAIAPALREMLSPILIPAFWFALMITIAMIFALKDKNFYQQGSKVAVLKIQFSIFLSIQTEIII